MQVPHLYTNNLLQDIAQLDTSSIEQLKADMEAILAKRKQIVKQKKEQQLVQKIHQYTASDTYKRYQVLLEKSRLETITTEDYQELMTLTAQIENNNTERLEHLMTLAKNREKTLREVMQELGLLVEKKEENE
jgi:conjugal transfer/entry exclusion protein